MLAYLILAGRNGRPVDPELLHRFECDVPDAVPFVSEECVVWKNRDGTVVFLGWQAFTELAGMRSHWAIDDRGLTAYAGHCWPRMTGWDHHSGVSWAAQLRAYLETLPLPNAREELYGQFTLVQLAETGEGIVTPDFASIDPVFVAAGDDVTAVSNRSGLCARAISPARAEPQRSLTGAAWSIAHTEMFFDGETGYWDVERMPLGVYIALSPGEGASVIEAERCPLGPMGETATYDELLPQVEEDMRRSIRAIATLPVIDRQLGLSGGIDSRLLTALIVNEGLETAFTSSPLDRPNAPTPWWRATSPAVTVWDGPSSTTVSAPPPRNAPRS